MTGKTTDPCYMFFHRFKVGSYKHALKIIQESVGDEIVRGVDPEFPSKYILSLWLVVTIGEDIGSEQRKKGPDMIPLPAIVFVWYSLRNKRLEEDHPCIAVVGTGST